MNTSKLEFWKKQIQTCKSSGLSVIQYCRNNRLSKSQYYYWHKIINESNDQSTVNPIFEEVLVEHNAPSCDGLKINCKNVEIAISSKQDIGLAVAFIHALQKQC